MHLSADGVHVNNAGISNNTTTYQDAKDVLNTNYYGVKTVTEALLPLLRASPTGARIINISSRAGLYEHQQLETSLKESMELRSKIIIQQQIIEPLEKNYRETHHRWEVTIKEKHALAAEKDSLAEDRTRNL